MRNTKYVPISPEVHKANKIETLEDYMKEWNCSQYEAAFDLTFEFYACAGFSTDILEKELKSMSKEALIYLYIEEL